MLAFHESLIAMNLEAPDCRTVIDVLAGKLYAEGFVTEEYAGQTYTRELEHPTGLPTKPFCIAFPHADSQGVNASALALATLANPVVFRNMADPDEELPVSLVLMLANRDPEEQIQTLRNLALLFSKPDKLVALRDQPTARDAAACLRAELHLEDRVDQRGRVPERRDG